MYNNNKTFLTQSYLKRGTFNLIEPKGRQDRSSDISGVALLINKERTIYKLVFSIELKKLLAVYNSMMIGNYHRHKHIQEAYNLGHRFELYSLSECSQDNIREEFRYWSSYFPKDPANAFLFSTKIDLDFFKEMYQSTSDLQI